MISKSERKGQKMDFSKTWKSLEVSSLPREWGPEARLGKLAELGWEVGCMVTVMD